MNAIRAHIDLMVENVHCAGCIARIERAVHALPGVEQARLNMSTRRLAVDFRDGTADAATIADTVTKLGYPATPFRAAAVDDSGAAEERRLLLALAVAGFAAGNVMLLSVSVWAGAVSDMGAATRELFHWISAAIALPAVVFSGRPFFVSAWRALRGRSMNMDVPISLAVILASAVSLFETAQGGPHAYFDAAVTLLFFLLIGRYLDIRARTRARSAAARLLSMAGNAARVQTPDGERLVPVAEVEPGMIVAVAAGEKVPVDGLVASGASDIDASLLTGEATPESVAVGAKVYAGTLNLTGPFTIRVTAAAGDTLLADIVHLMETAERGRSAYVKLVDRIARLYSPSVHTLALVTFLAWWLGVGAGARDALMNAVAVLIITCPCALGLAVPVVRVVAHGLLFARGVLVKASDALERIAQVDTVVFDKTGTLTRGEPELIERPVPGVLAEAAALACGSRHPLARAVADAGRDLVLPDATDVREVAGSGIEGTIGGSRVRLGRRTWAAPEIEGDDGSDSAELWLAASDGSRHRMRFRDALKDDAAQTVAALRTLGLKVAIISGDRDTPVAATARALGIADWQAACHPDDKVRAIARFAEEGRRVLMVGDGLNDAPALAAGFASASPAAAADISRTAADVVFQGTRLAPVLWLVRIARAAHGRVRENIALSILYNAFAVPMAVLGLVTPLVAAVAMSSSSILVTLNALRLRRARLAERI